MIRLRDVVVGKERARPQTSRHDTSRPANEFYFRDISYLLWYIRFSVSRGQASGELALAGAGEIVDPARPEQKGAGLRGANPNRGRRISDMIVKFPVTA